MYYKNDCVLLKNYNPENNKNYKLYTLALVDGRRDASIFSTNHEMGVVFTNGEECTINNTNCDEIIRLSRLGHNNIIHTMAKFLYNKYYSRSFGETKIATWNTINEFEEDLFRYLYHEFDVLMGLKSGAEKMMVQA
jgi:Icc-related predicted phosphoesterase